MNDSSRHVYIFFFDLAINRLFSGDTCQNSPIIYLNSAPFLQLAARSHSANPSNQL